MFQIFFPDLQFVIDFCQLKALRSPVQCMNHRFPAPSLFLSYWSVIKTYWGRVVEKHRDCTDDTIVTIK